jgi:hypothetical protein
VCVECRIQNAMQRSPVWVGCMLQCQCRVYRLNFVCGSSALRTLFPVVRQEEVLVKHVESETHIYSIDTVMAWE